MHQVLSSERRAAIGLVIALVLLCAFGIGLLAIDVARKISAQSVAVSDNLQWSLSQVEVEYMMLGTAVAASEADPQVALDAVRRRFDILYSRLHMLGESELYAEVRNNQPFDQASARLSGFLQKYTPLIDGNDAELQAALPKMRTEMQSLRPDAREIALAGINTFARISDTHRQNVSRTLILLASLTTALVAALMAMVVSLLRLDRQNQSRAHQIEVALDRSESVLATTLDPMIIIDREGNIQAFNAAAQATFGYTAETAIGANLEGLIIPLHLRDPAHSGLNCYVETAETQKLTNSRKRLEALRSDGALLPVEVAVTRAGSGADEIFVVFLRDLSQQLAAEQELLTARDTALAGERTKAEFLAVMSHEMRTPLNGMLGMIELLDNTQLSQKQKEFLRVLESSGRLLLHHVNGVLDISRLDAGKMPVVPQPVDLGRLVDEVFKNQHSVAEANGNRLRQSLPPAGQQQVLTDPNGLRQILLNLVGNAIKFTRNGEITLEIEHLEKAGRTEIRVIDTGIGIAEPDLARVFSDFVTLDASYARRAGGTGLGLGIVQRLVVAMGGEIGVESEPGEGSLFWVRLPMTVTSPMQGHATPGAAVAKAALPSMKILVVEDNPANRQVVREYLLADGHQVIEAHDGIEGVNLAEQTAFDVILMDISMPTKDGAQATREIRAGKGASRDTQIIALTAHALPEEAQDFLAAGMQQVLLKPVSRAALRRALAQASGALDCATPEEGIAKAEAGAIDAQVMTSLIASLGQEKAEVLVQDFLQNADQTLADLQQALDRGASAREIAKMTHKLAGVAGLVGAFPLVEALWQLEAAAKSNDLGRFRTALPILDEHVKQTRSAFSQIRQPPLSLRPSPPPN